ncbi:hypothetical protein NDU88_009585 [Pleurodeles waltl]|uniref:Uncharacterized protein n=1 Tax=Pleurodeles waltl TaxID=8319 RepID=A0AAV7PVB5_PLEWA|nr:hypothetical protein NDU88_009585 [Pleurodeles waltl]
MADDRVWQVLVLLEEAGRMDLMRAEVLSQMRPACKAAYGVAEAVWACSPRAVERPACHRCGTGSRSFFRFYLGSGKFLYKIGTATSA